MKTYSHKDVLTANRDYYDKVAEDYRQNERYAYSDQIVRDVLRVLKQYSFSLKERKKFLDFGCGSGFLSEIVHEHKLFESSLGVDISTSQVELFNKKFHSDKFKAVIADITRLPCGDNTFDMAGCYSVLHHIVDYEKVVEEVTRVLKPNGILYVDFEPNRKFRKLMAIPISIRRKLIDKAPNDLDNLERIAEYHHNIENGIDVEYFLEWLSNFYEIIEVKPRYPQALSLPLLKLFSTVSWSFVPYFYVVARKTA